MNDLISRQAAIERFDHIRPRDPMTSDYTHGIDVGIALCKVAIREQPLAQLGTNLAQLGTDCISRQDAIDALRDWEMCYDWDEHCREEPKAPWVVSPSGVINKLPSTQPEIIYCKDCRKHNKKVGFDENFHTVWKEDACPLVSWRGKAKGHEFDYQFCACAERREVTNGN